MNLLRYYPAAAGAALAALALLGIWILPPLPRIKVPPGRLSSAGILIGAGGAALAAALVFTLFRARSFLLGDGMEILRRLHQGTPPAPRSLLFNLVAPVFFEAFKGSAPAGESLGLSGLSVIVGATAVFLFSFFLLRTARRDAPAAATAAALFLLCGTQQLFFGYVESYPVLAAGTLVFYAAGFDRLTGGGMSSFVAASLGLVVAVLSHPFAVTLAPGWWLLAAARPGENGVRFDRRRLLLVALGGLGVVLGLWLVFVVKPEWRVRGSLLRYLAPQSYVKELIWDIRHIRTPKPWAELHPVGSAVHWADVANTLWLTGAAALAVLLAGLAGRDGRRALTRPLGLFALASAAGILLFRAGVRTPVGALRDWDLFSGLGYAAAGMAAALAFGGVGRSLVLPVAAAGLFFLLPWVGIQTSVDRAARRHFDGIEASPRPEPAVESFAHCVMGDRFANLRQYELADSAYRRALQTWPRYEFAWRLGMVRMAERRYAESADAMKEALRIRPDDRAALIELGEAQTGGGKLDEAARTLDRAIALYPDSGPAHLYRARVDLMQGRLDEGRARLEVARRLILPGQPARRELEEIDAQLSRGAAASISSPGGSDPAGRPP